MRTEGEVETYAVNKSTRTRVRSVWTAELNAVLRRRYATNEDTNHIARDLCVTAEAVRSQAKRLGIRRKLGVSREEWAEFRKMYCDGLPAREIAERFGIKESGVWKRAQNLGLRRNPLVKKPIGSHPDAYEDDAMRAHCEKASLEYGKLLIAAGYWPPRAHEKRMAAQ